MGIITFNGVPSDTLGVIVQEPPSYTAASKSYQSVTVPGRNGVVYMDDGNYANVKREYNIALDARNRNYYEVLSEVEGWLMSASGYARLEDSYDSEHYRLAVYSQESSFSNIYQQAGVLKISFDCMPQRWLKNGETPITLTGSGSYIGGTITNPTIFTAQPLLECFFSNQGGGTYTGHLDIGETRLDFAACTQQHIFVDSMLQNIYYENENFNEFARGTFPEIAGGSSTYEFNGFSKVIITPRWWRL